MIAHNQSTSEAFAWTIKNRRSVRAFTNRPVDVEKINTILELARYAPSGTNIQPWKVHVVTGQTLSHLKTQLTEAFNEPSSAEKYSEEYPYYPKSWVSPYIDRRRKVGWDLYTLLGIRKTDRTRMHAQHQRNFEFFGAPLALFFTIDRDLEQGSWLDYGMFIQSVMLAAKAHGLDTCPQAGMNAYHALIQKVIGWPDSDMLVCGMSMGYRDPNAVENTLITERMPLESFVQYHN